MREERRKEGSREGRREERTRGNERGARRERRTRGRERTMEERKERGRERATEQDSMTFIVPSESSDLTADSGVVKDYVYNTIQLENSGEELTNRSSSEEPLLVSDDESSVDMNCNDHKTPDKCLDLTYTVISPNPPVTAPSGVVIKRSDSTSSFNAKNEANHKQVNDITPTKENRRLLTNTRPRRLQPTLIGPSRTTAFTSIQTKSSNPVHFKTETLSPVKATTKLTSLELSSNSQFSTRSINRLNSIDRQPSNADLPPPQYYEDSRMSQNEDILDIRPVEDSQVSHMEEVEPVEYIEISPVRPLVEDSGENGRHPRTPIWSRPAEIDQGNNPLTSPYMQHQQSGNQNQMHKERLPHDDQIQQSPRLQNYQTPFVDHHFDEIQRSGGPAHHQNEVYQSGDRRVSLSGDRRLSLSGDRRVSLSPRHRHAGLRQRDQNCGVMPVGIDRQQQSLNSNQNMDSQTMNIGSNIRGDIDLRTMQRDLHFDGANYGSNKFPPSQMKMVSPLKQRRDSQRKMLSPLKHQQRDACPLRSETNLMTDHWDDQFDNDGRQAVTQSQPPRLKQSMHEMMSPNHGYQEFDRQNKENLYEHGYETYVDRPMGEYRYCRLTDGPPEQPPGGAQYEPPGGRLDDWQLTRPRQNDRNEPPYNDRKKNRSYTMSLPAKRKRSIESDYEDYSDEDVSGMNEYLEENETSPFSPCSQFGVSRLDCTESQMDTVLAKNFNAMANRLVSDDSMEHYASYDKGHPQVGYNSPTQHNGMVRSKNRLSTSPSMGHPRYATSENDYRRTSCCDGKDQRVGGNQGRGVFQYDQQPVSQVRYVSQRQMPQLRSQQQQQLDPRSPRKECQRDRITSNYVDKERQRLMEPPRKLDQRALKQGESEPRELDHRGFDRRRLDHRGLDEQRKSDRRVLDHRRLDQRVADQRVSDQRVSDQRMLDQRVADQTVSDQRLSDQRMDQRVLDQRVSDQRMDQRVSDQRVLDHRLSEQREMDQRALDESISDQGQFSGHGISDQRVSEQRGTDRRGLNQRGLVTDQGAMDQRMSGQGGFPEHRMTDQRWLDQRGFDNRMSEQRPLNQGELEGQRMLDRQEFIPSKVQLTPTNRRLRTRNVSKSPRLSEDASPSISVRRGSHPSPRTPRTPGTPTSRLQALTLNEVQMGRGSGHSDGQSVDMQEDPRSNFGQSPRDPSSSSKAKGESPRPKPVLKFLRRQMKASPLCSPDSKTNSPLQSSSLPNSSLPNSSLPNSSLPNSSLQNSSLQNSSLQNSSLQNSSLQNHSRNSPAVERMDERQRLGSHGSSSGQRGQRSMARRSFTPQGQPTSSRSLDFRSHVVSTPVKAVGKIPLLDIDLSTIRTANPGHTKGSSSTNEGSSTLDSLTTVISLKGPHSNTVKNLNSPRTNMAPPIFDPVCSRRGVDKVNAWLDQVEVPSEGTDVKTNVTDTSVEDRQDKEGRRRGNYIRTAKDFEMSEQSLSDDSDLEVI